ncbi:MAG: hypothetical protein E6J86_16110, partial [Deltaproteobacteria bacterium]
QRTLATSRELKPPPRPPGSMVDLAETEVPAAAREMLGSSLVAAHLLGARTAQLHTALIIPDDPAFAPEPYSALDQRSVYQTKRNLTGKVLRQLRSTKLEGRPAELAQQLLARESDLYASFEPLLRGRLTAQRGRIHGEYHLGNVLWTGKDFNVVDFSTWPRPWRCATPPRCARASAAPRNRGRSSGPPGRRPHSWQLTWRAQRDLPSFPRHAPSWRCSCTLT